MKCSLGFSPCPNDTFIFDALVNRKIDSGELAFDVVLEDVQTLNEWAIAGKLDITKLSYGVLPLVLEQYILLNSGSALGRGVGPLLITNKEPAAPAGRQGMMNVEDNVIAIPGEHTTAHLLFSLAYPNATKKVFLRYDKIEEFVLSGQGLGVIIHENRFTYQDKGLHKITDLGDYWEKHTGHSIPLGGIVIKRSLPVTIQQTVDRLIRESIEYAYRHHHEELNDYVKKHSQEMSEAVMRQHINLYVNQHSINLGEEGRTAVNKLLEVYKQDHPATSLRNDVFLH